MLDALGRVREVGQSAEVLDTAGRELCAAQIFDRVIVSRVGNSMWFPLTLYRTDERGAVTTEIGEAGIIGTEIPLASPLVEAEVVRRRLPALVQDAQHEPRVHRALAESVGTTEYVVAPVIVGNAVIGLLHADTPTTKRALGTVDRDLLRMFADGVGLVFDRVGLADRMERQRRSVTEACQAAVQSLDNLDRPEFSTFSARLPDVDAADDCAQPLEHREVRAARPQGRLARLTTRERQVLALLASGATNAQLADQLTVAESTVKSHVKHILHKLGAGNRAGAIACYLRETRDDERRPR